jgi:hypothetical protein
VVVGRGSGRGAADEREGGNRWITSANSGPKTVNTPGQGGLGVTTAGAVEMSNVDLAQTFTNMITAQRGFQANSRVISTADEMLQDLVNLKRWVTSHGGRIRLRRRRRRWRRRSAKTTGGRNP